MDSRRITMEQIRWMHLDRIRVLGAEKFLIPCQPPLDLTQCCQFLSQTAWGGSNLIDVQSEKMSPRAGLLVLVF